MMTSSMAAVWPLLKAGRPYTLYVTPEQYWQLKRLVRDINGLERTGYFRGERVMPDLVSVRHLMWETPFSEELWQYGAEKILGHKLDPMTVYEFVVVRG